MANEEHLVILANGVAFWNDWRLNNPREVPHLEGADLNGRDLTGINLHSAFLNRAYLWQTVLRGADLSSADLSNAVLSRAGLHGANLYKANLRFSRLLVTDVTGANLSECSVYGSSIWKLEGTPREQLNILITPEGEPAITVDNIELAQFIYLLLNNQKIRDVIETIGRKVVLILGRFTPDRKVILNAIRDELRKRDYLPVLFDFEKPSNRDITETVSTLAHMARFVIADITDAKSIPQELMKIVPALPSVPVQPVLLTTEHEWSMFRDLVRYPWVLEPFLYNDQKHLLDSLSDKVIDPAEAKAKEQTAHR